MRKNNELTRQLPLLIAGTFSVITLCVFIVFSSERVASYIEGQTQNSKTMCAVLGNTLQGALIFDDSKEAERILNALSKNKNVLEAAIFDTKGTILAHYNIPGHNPSISYATAPEISIVSINNILCNHFITLDGNIIGMISMRTSMQPLYHSIWTFLLCMLITMGITIILVIRLSHSLSNLVGIPISNLAKAMQRVSQEQNYSIAIPHSGASEVKELINGFNYMIARINDRDRRLARTMAQLRHAKEKADSSNKAKSQFLANMSHEIRTPLSGVLGMAELLERTPLSERQHRYALSILNSGKILLAVINDILDTSKIESGKLVLDIRKFDLARTVNDTLNTFQTKAAQKGLELNAYLPPGLPTALLGDPERIGQILFNLLGNAFKFTNQGSVSITVSFREIGTDRVEVRIEISDTGIGIPEEKLGMIFDRFSQADGSTTRLYGGTGLGLNIVRQLTALMQGRVSVSSTPGQGATFRVILPFEVATADDTTTVPAQDNEPTSAPPSSQASSILLVEDNPANQELGQEALTAIGHSVVVAANGELAVEAAGRASFDLILMDCQMPVMDGYTAARQIRAMEDRHGLSRTPIIAVTAHILSDNINRCTECGMDGYLQKPFTLSGLQTCVNRWTKQNEKAPG